MKRLAVGILAFIAVVALALVISATVMPSSYKIERSIRTDAIALKVFHLIGDLKQWPVWSPWRARDPGIKFDFVEPTNGVGGKMLSTGEKTGRGEIEITKYIFDERVEFKLVFMNVGKQALSVIRLVPQSDGTVITWSLEGERSYLEKLVWLVFGLQAVIEYDFDQGLTAIRDITQAHH